MGNDPKREVTELLARLGDDPSAGSAAAELAPYVYDELRRLARINMSRERPDHTLQPTDLVHEVYLKLVDQSRVSWQGRSHFFGVGAQMMRRILVDHARGRRQLKRGGELKRVTLVDAPLSTDLDTEELLALDTALEKLAAIDERQARVVELRYFGGLKVEEAAVALGVSKRTVELDWTHARAWLRRELGGTGDS
jgi:RNA polymerase sigma-70 factor (ECF subfamily)